MCLKHLHHSLLVVKACKVFESNCLNIEILAIVAYTLRVKREKHQIALHLFNIRFHCIRSPNNPTINPIYNNSPTPNHPQSESQSSHLAISSMSKVLYFFRIFLSFSSPRFFPHTFLVFTSMPTSRVK